MKLQNKIFSYINKTTHNIRHFLKGLKVYNTFIKRL